MSFEQDCLQAHNRYRQKHGASPLTLNPKMSADCKKFAEELTREKALRNGNAKDVGENIYAVSSTNPNFSITGDKAVEHWYANHDIHDYNQEPSGQLKAGNFTQVVWRGSKELGVGWAKKEGRIIVVARYLPAGNVMGQFCDNVGRVGDLAQRHTASNQGGACIPKQIAGAGSFNNDCLHAHNTYRAKHGVPPLKLDNDLCRYSQEWADELVRRGNMQHRDQSNYGENIFSAWSSDPTFKIDGGKAVDSWYDEIKFYTFGREPNDLKAGHFTQVVWRGSQKLGVGCAQRNGHIYVVCNYSPPGNYVRNYVANVPAPL